MPHPENVEALVLNTYDVGEADRFCILFTRERGRLAARASGARKSKSRMGSSLLPMRRVRAELRESAAGWIVAAAEALQDPLPGPSLPAFSAAAEGMELLLRLIQDGEPLPDVYDATVAFLHGCRREPRASLAFGLRLLHLLGFLPGEEEMKMFFALDAAERAFVHATRQGGVAPPLTDAGRVELLRDRFLQDQLSGPLKAPGVSFALGGGSSSECARRDGGIDAA